MTQCVSQTNRTTSAQAPIQIISYLGLGVTWISLTGALPRLRWRAAELLEFVEDGLGEFDLGVGVLRVESEGQRVTGLLVSVERIDEVLASDVIALSVIEKRVNAGDVLAALLGQRVVDDDEAILLPAVVPVFLQEFETFVIQRRLVPVVRREELVQAAFTARRQHVIGNTLDRLIS